jgi:magnesium-transporting ATPase (P-type)
VDVGKSIRFIFEDKQWLSKVLIGTLILLVSIPLTFVLVGFLGLAIVTGYSLDVLRNVRAGSTRPLPEWRDQWGEWLVEGLKLLLIVFVWSLPIIFLNVFTGIGDSMMNTNSGLLNLFGGMTVAVASCLALLWSIAVALVTPAIYIRLAETRELASGFQFNAIYVWTRDRIGDVVIAVLLSILLTLALTLVGAVIGVLLCGVGLVLTLPAAVMLSTLVTVHLYAQIGPGKQRQPQTSVAKPTPPAPPAESQPKETTMVVGPDGTIIVTPKSDA